MCLTCRVGKRSQKTKPKTQEWLKAKQKKLNYAQKLLTWLATTNPNIEVIDATPNNEPPIGLNKKTLKETIT